MITETIYNEFELEKGKCNSCGEETEEILIGTDQCVGCIETDKFYEETMKGL